MGLYEQMEYKHGRDKALDVMHAAGEHASYPERNIRELAVENDVPEEDVRYVFERLTPAELARAREIPGLMKALFGDGL